VGGRATALPDTGSRAWTAIIRPEHHDVSPEAAAVPSKRTVVLEVFSRRLKWSMRRAAADRAA
jgi:hypothetical protein